MKPFSKQSLIYASILASSLAFIGSRKKSLSRSGAIAGFFVGFLSIACGWRGMLVIVFYQLGSWATKFKKNVKERVDATAAIASSRGASQVLGCSAIAVGCALAHAILCGEEKIIHFPHHATQQSSSTAAMASKLTCGIIAHYATCLGDTLASELGILSNEAPVLILKPWKKVPHGTNGGITVWGTLCSIFGGAIIGLATVLLDTLSGVISPTAAVRTSDMSSYILTITQFGAVCGFIGSLLDSLLGATLQASYYDPDEKIAHDAGSSKNASNLKHISGINILSNVQVNLISVLLTTYFGACVLGPYLFNY
jgi:uncharacterized protein (TIGR00297 family)